MRPQAILADSLSLRSFRVARPSSPKASSLKQRGTISFANLLGSSRDRPSQPTLQDLSRPSLDEIDIPGLPPLLPNMPNEANNSTPVATTVQQDANPLQRPRSKSRTIIRMLTTKFSTRSASPTPAPGPSAPRMANIRPPAAPNAYSKDARDAALRARGLLPPLAPNKDLSLQEAEQDMGIPVVSLESATEPIGEQASEADRIKREWELKNRTVEAVQRERMGNFKFGGNASSTSLSSPTVPETQSPLSTAQVEATDHLAAELPTTPMKLPAPLPLPPLDPVEPSLQLTPELEAYMFPLPPSPLPSPSLQVDALSIISSLSPVVADNTTSLSDASGACTPRPIAPDASARDLAATPTLHSPPVISLTPPTAFPSPATDSADDATPSSPTSPRSPLAASEAFHARTDSFAQLEETVSSSSILTPSLSSDSGGSLSRAESTSSGMASSSILRSNSNSSENNVKTPPLGLGKLGGLNIKTNDNAKANVPVILESPIRDGGFSIEGLDVVVEEPEMFSSLDVHGNGDGLSLSLGMGMDSMNGMVTAASPEPMTPTSPRLMPPQTLSPPQSPTTAVPRARKRGVTDPSSNNDNVDRRKSLNPFAFKRSTSQPRSKTQDATDDDQQQPQRRLTVAASFSNMRRSVVGTLSSKPKTQTPSVRTTSTGASDDKSSFDASHLPASPPLSPAFSKSSYGSSGRSQNQPRVMPRPRQAVAPIMYNRGSILIETSAIEDEESRRMTEMAFLG